MKTDEEFSIDYRIEKMNGRIWKTIAHIRRVDAEKGERHFYGQWFGRLAEPAGEEAEDDRFTGLIIATQNVLLNLQRDDEAS